MNNINRIMIALLLFALLYALYRYQQSCQKMESENIVIKEIATTDKINQNTSIPHIQDGLSLKNPNSTNKTSQMKRVQFSQDNNYIDNDSIDLDHISQMSLGSLNSENTNLSLESRSIGDNSLSDNDSLFDNLSIDSRESKDFFFA